MSLLFIDPSSFVVIIPRQRRVVTALSPDLHLGELLEERVVLLEALFGLLEHRHRLLLADLLDQLLEAVLAEFLRDGVLRERDRVGLVPDRGRRPT